MIYTGVSLELTNNVDIAVFQWQHMFHCLCLYVVVCKFTPMMVTGQHQRPAIILAQARKV